MVEGMAEVVVEGMVDVAVVKNEVVSLVNGKVLPENGKSVQANEMMKTSGNANVYLLKRGQDGRSQRKQSIKRTY